MDHNTLATLAIAAETRLPCLIEGPPGGAKTEGVVQVCAALGITPQSEEHPLWIPNPSSADPSDFSGPLTKGTYRGKEVSRYTPPEEVVRLQLSKPGKANPYAEAMGLKWLTTGAAIFVSEFTTLHPRVQAPLLALFDYRKSLGTHLIPEWVWPLGDCNPTDLATNGQELSFPMLSRMLRIPWEVNVNQWADALVRDFPPLQIPTVPPEWLSHLPVSRALIASFAKKNPESIYSASYFAQLKDADRNKSYPTLRPWTWFARGNAAWMAMGADEEVRFSICAGLVGNAAAQAFAEYVEHEDLPDTKEWLENPGKFQLSKRGDIAMIGLTSMVAHVCQSKNPDWWKSAWAILNMCLKQGHGDLAIMVCSPLIPLYREDEKKFPITTKDLDAFLPMMKASGMID